MLKKILSYSFGMYAVSLFASLVRILVKSIIAKTVGKEALGAYAYYMTIIMIASALLAFGIRRAITRQVAGSLDEERAAPLIVAVTVMGLAASLLLAGTGLALSRVMDWIFVMALVSVGPYTLYEVARATLRGQMDQKREIIVAFLGVVVQAACVLLYLSWFRGTRSPVWGLTAANILLALGIVLYLARRYSAHWRPGRIIGSFQSAEFRALMLLSAPLWVTDILGIIGSQADQLIVQGKLGYAVLAEYAAAFSFIGILDQPITVMSRVFLVSFSGGYYSDFEQYQQVASYNLALFSLLGLGVAAVSVPLTPLIFTSQFTLVPLLVAILSITCIFNSVEVLNTSLTIAKDFPQANRDAKLWATLLYIPLLFWLVWRFGVTGAACGSVLSWGIYAVAHALYMRKRLPEHAAYTLRIMISGALLYAGAVTLVLLGRSLWLTPLIMLAYIGLGHLLHLWDLRQVPDLIRRMLPGRLAHPTFPEPEADVDSKHS